MILSGTGSRKVAIIGAGFVGSSIAYALTLRELARQIVLIDINEDKARGEAWDIRHGISFMGTADLAAGTYADCRDCDLIIITAGRNRRPGENRLDLAADNVRIMHDVISSIQPYYSGGVILLISNPVDILVQKSSEWLDLPNGMLFGSGCILDTSRLVRSVADYVSLDTSVVNGYVAGEHGDSQVPIWSRFNVGGSTLADYCENMNLRWDAEQRQQIFQQVKSMGGEIIKTKGRTHYGIATCVCSLADAILNQHPTIAPVSSPLKGEHGVRDVALSVPSVVGPRGVQQRLREKWTDEEYRGFFDSVESVRKVLKSL